MVILSALTRKQRSVLIISALNLRAKCHTCSVQQYALLYDGSEALGGGLAAALVMQRRPASIRPLSGIAAGSMAPVDMSPLPPKLQLLSRPFACRGLHPSRHDASAVTCGRRRLRQQQTSTSMQQRSRWHRLGARSRSQQLSALRGWQTGLCASHAGASCALSSEALRRESRHRWCPWWLLRV